MSGNLFFKPIYRLTVYNPPSIDPSESTPLLPAANSFHSDPFIVCTAYISGSQPYMNIPSGRRGTLDPTKGTVTVGDIIAQIIDANTNGQQSRRWLTAYEGDATGIPQIVGNKAGIEESLDGGQSFHAWFGGRVTDHTLNGPLMFSMTISENVDDLKWTCFPYAPHISASATMQSICPIGLATNTYGPFTSSIPLTGSVIAASGSNSSSTAYIQTTGAALNYSYNIVTDILRAILSPYETVTSVVVGTSSLPAGGLSSNPQPVYDTVYVGTQAANTGSGQFGCIVNSVSGSKMYAINSLGLGTYSNKVRLFNVGIGEGSGSNPYWGKAKNLPVGTNQAVRYRIVPTYLPCSTSNPVFLDGHPAQILYEMFLGYYGYIDPANGLPLRVQAVNSQSFANLVADNSFPMMRVPITAPMSQLDFINKYIWPYGIGVVPSASYINGTVQSVFVAIDQRTPTSSFGLPQVTGSDLANVQNFQCTPQKPISQVTLTTYSEQAVIPPNDSTSNFNGWLIVESTYPTVYLNPEGIDINGQMLAIDVKGVRAPDLPPRLIPDNFNFNIGNPFGLFQGITALILRAAGWYQNDIYKLLLFQLQRFGVGAAQYQFDCRRTAVPSALQVGQWCVLSIDPLPDPTTHLRGGNRIVQITERWEAGPIIKFKAWDGGANVNAVAPTVGAPTVSSLYPLNGFKLPIQGQLSQSLIVQVANEASGSNTQPAVTSKDWRTVAVIPHPNSAKWLTTTSSVSYEIPDQPGSTRAYIRVQATQPGLLPSAFVSPSPAFFDIPIVLPITNLTSTQLASTDVQLNWSNTGDTTSNIVIAVAQPRTDQIMTLAMCPPGTTQYTIAGLSDVAADNPTLVSLCHMDRLHGASPTSSLTFTLSGSYGVLPPVRLFTTASINTILAKNRPTIPGLSGGGPGILGIL